ncbi:hypothetical protein CIG2463D_0914 [Campylobacter iguaniorum]|uniref:ATPase, AAA family n=1 Tax=Campylobacter iguaniorum TaxID=1244531 RepID=A0A076FBC5_9BACT|nr:ATP-binding protein [Campylobacter iguaniorum]AII14752.1 ATPase, AAA family [Campylobacter iguaniorum]ALV24487.1 hypothetical protein CIG2463D_0914 [Campylobacter iguaniorum]
MNKYTKLKEIFIEENGVFDYVNLDKSTLTYHKILNALQKPLKLILFYGKPGSGKTFLLNKICNDLSSKQKVIFFPQPFFNEKEFINTLYFNIFGQNAQNIDSYEEFMRVFKEKYGSNLDTKTVINPQDQIILLLDEAQLYPDYLIEKIRLMADTRYFKILFTVHKTSSEDVLAKDYFKTRIWESIELTSSNLDEISLYIEKKLLFHDEQAFFSMFKHSQLKLIHKLTNGNLRTLNRLMHKIYEIYEHYEANKPSFINSKYMVTQIIEMAAIDSELLDA